MYICIIRQSLTNHEMLLLITSSPHFSRDITLKIGPPCIFTSEVKFTGLPYINKFGKFRVWLLIVIIMSVKSRGCEQFLI